MRPGGWRWLKWASLLVATGSIVLAIFLIGSEGPQLLSKGADHAKGKPRTEVEAPVIVERKDGRIIWQLRARAANQQLNGQMHLIAPQLRLYSETGKQVHISGEQAWFNPLKRNVRFQDNVKVLYQSWTLTSQSLIYNSSSDEVHIPGTFSIHGNDITAHGKNMILHRISEQVNVSEGIWIKDTNAQWQGAAPR